MSGYISVDIFQCDTLSFLCLFFCRHSKSEAATLFGNEERFPCLSPSASNPSVFKTLFAIVLVHRAAAGFEESTMGHFNFLCLFNNL